MLFPLKVGLALYVASEAVSWGSSFKLLAALPLLMGADVLGAAVVGALAAAWGRRGWAVAVQAPHAFIAAASTMTVVELGGPLNRSFLGLTFMMFADWTPMMAASTSEYFSPPVCALLALFTTGGVVAALRPPLAQAWPRRVRGGLAALVVATFAFTPVAKGGGIGLRLQTHDLEVSPWVELVASYVRPGLRTLSTLGETRPKEFRFDWSPLEQPDGTLLTPLAEARPRPSNLLVVLQESVGRRYLDHPDDPMPYMRGRLSAPDTVALEQHHATWSLTTKALFSLLCSEMPYPTYRPVSYVNPAIPCASLSNTLQEAGWFTAMVTSQFLDFDRLKRFLRHRAFDTVWDAETMPGGEGRWRAPWGLEDQVAVDALLGLVAQRRKEAPDQPWFILHQQVSGHHPFIATERQSLAPSGDRVANYLRALRAADDATRAVVEGLAGQGVLEDTLVVIVADHGEGHGRHAGRNAYEPVVHVPALIFGPQTRGAGGAVSATTSMIDVAPTLLALLGQQVPCPMQGRDLTQASPRRLALFGGRPPRFQIGLADGRFHFILEDGRREMLFDVLADPDETHNLVLDHPARTQAYRRRVEAWQTHSADLIEGYASSLASSGCPPPRSVKTAGSTTTAPR